MKESKEKIKARMIRNASRLWGFTETESESSFDPMVGMIMGALSNELEIVSEDIQSTESRIVEKLIQLVTPEPITGPFPAHAVLRAVPVQPIFEIRQDYQFYLYQKFRSAEDPGKKEEKSVFFTPTGQFRLFNGSVRHLACGNKLFEFRKEGYKEVIAEAERGRGLPLTSFWLGIDLNEEVETLDGMRLYFEMRNDQHAASFLQSLPRGKWLLNGQPVSAASGYGNGQGRFRNELEDVIRQEVEVTAKIIHHVNHFYERRFITLETGDRTANQLAVRERYPQAILDSFRTDEIEAGPRNLFWLEIRHNQPLPQEIADELHCSLNCFPVINRQLVEFTVSSRDAINVIPLETEDSFLDMRNVSNTSGKAYVMKAFSGIGKMEKGSYILRQGGIARFDSRNAREMINYLLELLRDESAAFSVLGTDMISSNLRELNQGIARLEQRLQDSQMIRENLSYLMLKADQEDDLVFVEFWSTKGSAANKVKAGTKLMVYEGSDIRPDSIVLVTPTLGGRDKMDTEERLNAYRRALLSRSRVVTPEDVKVLCYEHFGKAVEKVEVTRGVTKGNASTTGFVRTIDVHITLSKRVTPFSKEELVFLEQDLQVKLREQSSNILPFRIFLD
ncbi:MAG: hypothetical protein R6V75_10010 [Bacteroidales bacterium]